MKILYILMRNDMTSMNPGKACAQAAHAANMFIKYFGTRDDVKSWTEETKDGFGTTIVMSVNQADLSKIWVEGINSDCPAGMVTDPTYPIRDGEVVHYVSVITCGFIFGEKKKLAYIIDKINLMP